MTSLASMLVGELLSLLLEMALAGISAQIWLWAWMPGRWQPSQLPADRWDDPAWDEAALGWWCDDLDSTDARLLTGPGVAFDGLAYRWKYPASTGRTELQFLLTIERVNEPWRWNVDGAQL